jgi:hypothetical protein
MQLRGFKSGDGSTTQTIYGRVLAGQQGAYADTVVVTLTILNVKKFNALNPRKSHRQEWTP